MDDAIGWIGFCSTGVVMPWSGFTVQINTKLMKPVTVGSLLRIEAKIDRREGDRKVWCTAKLTDEFSTVTYCEGQGLFLLNKDQAAVIKVNNTTEEESVHHDVKCVDSPSGAECVFLDKSS